MGGIRAALLVILALFAVAVAVGVSTGLSPGVETEPRDVARTGDGGWVVLEDSYDHRSESSQPDDESELLWATVYVFDDDWNEERRVDVPAHDGDSQRWFERVVPVASGGWWLEAKDGSAYRVAADGSLVDSASSLPSDVASSPGAERVDPARVDVDNEFDGDHFTAAVQATDGPIWVLSQEGIVYRYTAAGQYTATKHDVVSSGVFTDPTVPSVDWSGLFVWGVLISVSGMGLLHVVVSREHGVLRSLAFAVLSPLVASVYLWYWLPDPIAVLYSVPDPVHVFALLAIPIGEAVFQWRRSPAFDQTDVYALLAINAVVLYAAVLLVG